MSETQNRIPCPRCDGTGIGSYNTSAPEREPCDRCDGSGTIRCTVLVTFPGQTEAQARLREHFAATRAASLVTEQAPPLRNEHPAVWDLVLADMQARDAEGRRKYGVPLQPHNGRNALVDSYQEQLDDIVYTRQAIEELKQLGAELRALQATAEQDGQIELVTALGAILRKYTILS